ncbi:MAG: hypothetical protein EPO68_04890 [Planctomycetota bacterium]|nr:MAG: hypothetical protein EPO68_04890 [Planctomycetota bacterium]
MDAAGASGAQFAAIQPAIDAAQDGDTVLVRTGQYAGFALIGKGVAIVARDPVRIDGAIQLGSIPAQSTALLAGFDVHGPDASTAPLPAALRIDESAGSIWLQDLVVTGGAGAATTLAGGDALAVLLCDDVHAVRCEFSGGKGSSLGGGASLLGGGDGVRVSDAHVELAECVMTGGAGGDQADVDKDSALGGFGLLLSIGSVDAVASVFAGGAGGTTAVPPVFGGPGGTGCAVLGDGALARLSGCTLQGGAPGAEGAPQGEPFATGIGASIALLTPGFQPSETELANFAAVGEAANAATTTSAELTPVLVFALFSPSEHASFEPSLNALLLDPSAALLFPLGSGGGKPAASFAWTVPELPAGFGAATVWVQLGALWLQAPGQADLGSARAFVITQGS